jgi:hypothetical protein
MSAVAGFPSLSQLLAWPTEHLTEAADHWEAIGGRSYGVANQVWQDALSIDWQGAAADALRSATHTDMLITGAVADQLHAAAKVARSGASDLYTARSRMRYAVDDVRTAGFDVSEDLSVTDRSRLASAVQRAGRQAEAQLLAGDIRQRAAQLLALDQQVAGKVTAAVAGIRDTFPSSSAPDTPPRDNRVHAVDNHIYKKDPPTPPGPPGNPFAGWTDEQMAQVATEIAHGHAWNKHSGDFPRGWTERDLARWIYNTMKDPNTRVGTSIDSGGVALFRDGKVIFVDPHGPDFGTAFAPKPHPGGKWRTPEQYFEQHTRAVEPLPPPTPGRLPPLTSGEMAPPAPAPEPAPAPRPTPPPVQAPVPKPAPVEPPAARPGPPLGSFGGGGGGGIPGLGIGGLHTPTEEVD